MCSKSATNEEKCTNDSSQLHIIWNFTLHVHLLVTPSTPTGVSLLIRDLGRDYVRTINKTYRRSGTLWEGRFKSSLVDSDRYCLVCYRYIELNPVRAKMVERPEEYPWSSFRSNALGDVDALLSPHSVWLALDRDDQSRQKHYIGLFNTTLEEADVHAIRYNLRKGLPTGSDQFKRKIEAALSIKLGTGKRGRPRKQVSA